MHEISNTIMTSAQDAFIRCMRAWDAGDRQTHNVERKRHFMLSKLHAAFTRCKVKA